MEETRISSRWRQANPSPDLFTLARMETGMGRSRTITAPDGRTVYDLHLDSLECRRRLPTTNRNLALRAKCSWMTGMPKVERIG